MFSTHQDSITDKVYEEGFSLLETLIALSILSLISLAMFQSTLQLLSVSQKSVDIADQMVDEFVLQKTFRNIVLGLTHATKDQQDYIFTGDTIKFSGLSSFDDNSSLSHMTVSLQTIDNRRANIVVNADNEQLVLGTMGAADLRFSYLGWDHSWYDHWPLEDVPSTGFFDDNLFLEMPEMPLAIRLSSQSNQLFLVAARKKPEKNSLDNALIP